MRTHGDHDFIPGGAAYAGGVRAHAGFAITRVLFARPIAYQAGFAVISRHLSSVGRPTAALCATELRVPVPLTLDGFAEFNTGYGTELDALGVRQHTDNGPLSPLARTNVAPLYTPLDAPSLAAFCYTVPAADSAAAFVVAGCGDIRDDTAAAIIAAGDISPIGLRTKAAYIVGELAMAMQILGVEWREVTDLTVYTTHAVHDLLETVIYPVTGAPASGVHLIAARPPIVGLDLELDLRGVQTELRLAH